MKSSLDKLGKEPATAKQLETIKQICKRQGTLDTLDSDDKWTKQRATEFISYMIDLFKRRAEGRCSLRQDRLVADICKTLDIQPPPNCKEFEGDTYIKWCSRKDAREFIKAHIEEYKKVAPITDKQWYRIEKIEQKFSVTFEGKTKYDAKEFISKYYTKYSFDHYDEDKFAWYTEEDFY